MGITRKEMGWFSKKGSDVVDFTKFRKAVKADSDIKDLTQAESNPLGFLGAIAGSSEPSSSIREIENIHLKDLKVKMEDVEYKLDNLSRKLGGLMDRIDLIEKKVDRSDRRGEL